jgi:hypothetical protein
LNATCQSARRLEPDGDLRALAVKVRFVDKLEILRANRIGRKPQATNCCPAAR